MVNPREELLVAHGERAKAHARLDALREQLGRAEKVLASIVAGQEAHDAEARAAAEQRAEKLLATIKAGDDTGKLEGDDRRAAAHEARERTDALHRHAAERAVAELQQERVEAERLLEAAGRSIDAAVDRVLAEKADGVAEEWERLVEAAAVLRRRLGRQQGVVEKATKSDRIRQALLANWHELSVGVLDARREHQVEMELVEGVWTGFRASLEGGDVSATLSFADVNAESVKATAEARLSAQIAEAVDWKARAAVPAAPREGMTPEDVRAMEDFEARWAAKRELEAALR